MPINNCINHGDKISNRSTAKITLASQLVFYMGINYFKIHIDRRIKVK